MFARKRPPLPRVDFPDSGENVRAADKRGAGPAGLSADRLTGGENFSAIFSPSVKNQRFLTPPSSEGGFEVRPYIIVIIAA